jgi:hypothetical protein
MALLKMRLPYASDLSDSGIAGINGRVGHGDRTNHGRYGRLLPQRDLATVGDPVRVNPDQRRYETLLKEGLLLRRQIQLRPGAAKVRVVVFDRGSGRLGSLEFPAPR